MGQHRECRNKPTHSPATQNKSYCLPHTKKETATYLFLFPTCWEEVTNCAFQNPGLREVRRLDDPCEKSPWSLGLGAEKMEAARFKREGGGCSRWCQDLPDAKAESGTLGASGQHLDMMLGEASTVVRGLVTVMPGESQGRRSLVGCRLRGCTESDTTDAT